VNQDLLKKVFRAFDPPQVLPPDDPRYVECDRERGTVGLLDGLVDRVRGAAGYTCQLVSGQQGCGKTTELLRFRQDLLQGEPRYFVVYCDAAEYVDLNDAEYPDILLAVVRQVWRDAKAVHIRPVISRLLHVWEDLPRTLDTVPGADKDSSKAGIPGLGFDFKGDPQSRYLAREHLGRRASRFLEAVNEVLTAAAQALRKDYAGLVVIVDSLDRIFRNPLPGTTRTNHDALFVDAAEYLRNLACHVIYTMPQALLYSPSGAKLEALYGSSPHTVSLIPVTTRSGADDEEGRNKLLEAVTKRLYHAGTAVGQVFDSVDTIRQLGRASGGSLRKLMMLTQNALAYADDLPLTACIVEQAIRDARDALVRSVGKTRRWQLLREIAQTKQVAASEDYLELLDSLFVLGYRDADGPWFDVNPLIQEVPWLAR